MKKTKLEKLLSKLSDKELLQNRLCDLPLELSNIPFSNELKQLGQELKSKGIDFSPRVWIAEDWYSPDGSAGFAIPLYLCHERLTKLQKKHVGFIEGQTRNEFLKLIRHETAHALDNAFYLRKNKKRQALFGLTSTPYPLSYDFNPNSIDYVIHLKDHYAQAHPDEDWAETFSVWLNPKSNWKNKYKNWKIALDKLNFVDQVMNGLKEKQQSNYKYINSSLQTDTRTLEQYFLDKKNELKLDRNNFFTAKVKNVFTQEKLSNSDTAYSFLKTYQKDLGHKIAKRKKVYPHIISKMLHDLGKECKNQKYHLKYSQEQTMQLFRKNNL